MTTQLTTFSFNLDTNLRTVELEGSPWFVAADICRVLGHTNVSQALKRLDGDEQALISNEGIHRGSSQVTVVNESGLYSLILGSRKPEAKAFKKWVTSEVLPAIRKTGSYAANQILGTDISLLQVLDLENRIKHISNVFESEVLAKQLRRRASRGHSELCYIQAVAWQAEFNNLEHLARQASALESVERLAAEQRTQVERAIRQYIFS